LDDRLVIVQKPHDGIVCRR